MLPHLQVLQDVTAEEFQQFVDVLLQLRTMATRKGAQDLVDIVANQADLSSDFQVSLLMLPCLMQMPGILLFIDNNNLPVVT